MRHSLRLLLGIVFSLQLLGCGGSSVELPEDVLTDETYAVQWIDFGAIEPGDGVKLFGSLSGDMSDTQAQARLWLSAEADDVDIAYRERWEAFTDSGCQGILTVYYLEEKTEGELLRTTEKLRRHCFIKASAGTSAKQIEDAITDFADDDGSSDFDLEEVGDKTGWFWITSDNPPEDAPALPDKGDEEVTKTFAKLLAEGGDAPSITAWRSTKPISESIKEALDQDSLGDDKEQDLKYAKGVQSIVLTCTPGRKANSKAAITFDDKDLAKAYAQDHNDAQRYGKAAMKRMLVSVANPPEPELFDRLSDEMTAKASGKVVTVSLDGAGVQDMVVIVAALRGTGGDITSPRGLVDLDDVLRVPGATDVPGVRSCYDGLSFGRSKQPK